MFAEIDAASGRLVVRPSSQMLTAVSADLRCHPGLAPEEVRRRRQTLGGGLVMKGGVYPEDIVVAYAAWTPEAPGRGARSGWRGPLRRTVSDVVSRRAGARRRRPRTQLRVRAVANIGGYGTAVGAMIPPVVGPWSRRASTTSRPSICTSPR